MRFVLCSDIHLQNSGMFARPLSDGLTSRAMWGLCFMEWLYQFLEDDDLLVITGDTFSQKNLIPVPLYNQTYKMMDRIAKKADILIMPGNHDRYMRSENPEANSIYTMGQGITRLDLIAHPSTRVYGNCEFVGVPAGWPFPKLDSAKPRKGRMRVMLIHENVIGAVFQTGKEVEHGVSKKEIFEYMQENHINYCFCGDIHKPQILYGNNTVPLRKVSGSKSLVPQYSVPCIVILGAPYLHDFGDEGQARGIWTFETETRKMEFIPYDDGPNFLTITDENFKKEFGKKHEGEYFTRFRISLPNHREKVDRLETKSPERFKDFNVVEYTSSVEEGELTPTDAADLRKLVGDYVQDQIEACGFSDKMSAKVVAVGLKYYDKAHEHLISVEK